MSARGKTGKRSGRGQAKRQRYRQENRRSNNKILKIKREIKRLEGILLRSPEAKVSRNIEDLKERIKAWQKGQGRSKA
jgi:hypothetical protein